MHERKLKIGGALEGLHAASRQLIREWRERNMDRDAGIVRPDLLDRKTDDKHVAIRLARNNADMNALRKLAVDSSA